MSPKDLMDCLGELPPESVVIITGPKESEDISEEDDSELDKMLMEDLSNFDRMYNQFQNASGGSSGGGGGSLGMGILAENPNQL